LVFGLDEMLLLSAPFKRSVLLFVGTLKERGIFVATVGSRSVEKARSFLDGYRNHDGLPDPIPCGSYEEAMAHPHVQGVYVSVPTALEEPVVMRALELGRHVLADKPLSDAASVRRMTQKAIECKLLLMDATHFVHNPRTAALKAYLEEQGHDKFHTLIATFYAGPMPDDNIRNQSTLEPMGAIGDLGWYTARACVEFLTTAPISSVFSANVRETRAFYLTPLPYLSFFFTGEALDSSLYRQSRQLIDYVC
jgi:predicted dehydrogenase